MKKSRLIKALVSITAITVCLCIISFSGHKSIYKFYQNFRNNINKSDFILYQLPSVGGSQMMSYVLKTTKNNKLIVIDGGTHAETAYLRKFIKEQGGHVDLWIITHPHDDHVNALTDILLSPENIKIDKIFNSLPERSWIAKYEPISIVDYDNFVNALSKSNVTNQKVKLRQEIFVDGVKIEFLSVNNPEIIKDAINNSSVTFKVNSSKKSVLFLADAEEEEGEKILKEIPATVLKSEYVQMAHHGQNGVSKEFYKVVSPKYCLWPTPKWLWENDPGTGYNTGEFKTLRVRSWMDELEVKKNYESFKGLTVIE